MSRDSLDELRDAVTEAEQVRDDAASAVEALGERLKALPGAGATGEAIERRYRARAIRHCLIFVVMAAVAFGLYRGLLHPTTSYTKSAEGYEEGVVEGLNAEIEKLTGEEAEKGFRAMVQIHQDAFYPAALGQAGGRLPYPTLHELAPDEFTMDPVKDDGIWRWVHIGVAACTVGDKGWSARAVDALNWLASTRDSLGLPVEDYRTSPRYQGNQVARDAMPFLLAHCFMAGQLSLGRDRPTPGEMVGDSD